MHTDQIQKQFNQSPHQPQHHQQHHRQLFNLRSAYQKNTLNHQGVLKSTQMQKRLYTPYKIT